MEDSNIDIKEDKHLFALWSEAMIQLRHLSSDVWNGIRLFLTLNSILLAALIGVSSITDKIDEDPIFIIITMVGISLLLFTINILKKQRNHYLDMFIRKTLLEEKLGLYSSKISGIDLSFAWSVPENSIKDLKDDKEDWKKKQRWNPKTISGTIFFAFLVFFLIYIVILFISINNIL